MVIGICSRQGTLVSAVYNLSCPIENFGAGEGIRTSTPTLARCAALSQSGPSQSRFGSQQNQAVTAKRYVFTVSFALVHPTRSKAVTYAFVGQQYGAYAAVRHNEFRSMLAPALICL